MYINENCDTLSGDLNLNENKITLKDSKAEIQHIQGDDFDGTVLETDIDLHLQIFRIIRYSQPQQIFCK